MNKKILLTLIVICISILSLGVTASAETYGKYTYAVTNGEVKITMFDENASGSIKIPEKISSYPVTAIGNYAFYYCDNVTEITIPASVKNIGECAFSYCRKLTAINVDSANPNFSSADGILFDKNKKTLIQYPIGNDVSEYKVPDSVTAIGNDAFCVASSLTSVIIGSNVSIIGERSFYGCINLRNVSMSDSVTVIGDSAFSKCISLKNITLGSSIKTIGVRAFYECESLSDITIPKSVSEIGSWAFSRCKKLTSLGVDGNNQYYTSIDGVLYNKDKTTLICHPAGKTNNFYVIAEGVEKIDSRAFYMCTNLERVEIPDTVTSIEKWAFSECSKLIEITLPSRLTVISDWMFSGCTELTKVVIPEGITHIGSGAFNYCKKLAEMKISKNMESVGDKAFYSCSNIEEVLYYGTEKTWDEMVIGSNNDVFIDKVVFVKYTETAVSENKFTVSAVNVEDNSCIILALYKNGRFIEAKTAIYEGEAVPFTRDKTYTDAKVMVWDSLSGMSHDTEAENL